jgi:steroid 5-alpha reductase family enzyme
MIDPIISTSSSITLWFYNTFAVIPLEFWWFIAIALVISSGGFYRLVYFISIGYAFSILGMAIASLVIFRPYLEVLVILQCVGLGLYGLRLGGYLISREFYPSYRKELVEIQQRATGVNWLKKLFIWLAVSLLYALMFSPCLFNLSLSRTNSGNMGISILFIIGLSIMALGLLLETVADYQKSSFKKQYPKRFCDVGLYKWVRCPNYLGEILFWVGNWVAGIAAYHHWIHWSFSLIGLLCIILIMMGSTKRLEHKQDERYGELSEYREYISTVPVIIPFIPLYSLKKVRVYLE